jgi:hypothetical protein
MAAATATLLRGTSPWTLPPTKPWAVPAAGPAHGKVLDAGKHYTLTHGEMVQKTPVPAKKSTLLPPPATKPVAAPVKAPIAAVSLPAAKATSLPPVARPLSAPSIHKPTRIEHAGEISVKAPAISVADEASAPAANTEIVYPMGDFRYTDRSRARKLDALMGIAAPPVPRREFELEEQRLSERPATEVETWESSRARARAVASEASEVAYKRDGEAWEDEDGYAQVREPPAHRDGYNFTLRVKPAPEAHLHNGLNSLPMATARPESSVVHAMRAEDAVHRCVSTRSDIAAIVGALFVRGIYSGIVGTSDREDAMTVDGARVRGEIELLLRMLEELETPPDGHVTERVSAEVARRTEHDTLGRALGNAFVSGVGGMALPAGSREAARRTEMNTLARALGNAFVSIGMTLPAGTREDPLRSDSVALEIGNRVMAADTGAAHGVRIAVPDVPESLRKEVAIAVGRALLHLRAAAGMYGARLGAPTVDAAFRDRTVVTNVGRLTLQLLEASALRAGKTLTRDPHRREVLANALGSTVMSMDALLGPSTVRAFVAERERADASALIRAPAPLPALAAPAPAKMEVPRPNKVRDVVLKRPLLPGRDVVPVELLAQAAALPALTTSTRSRRG